jgi:hypothetical protein
VTVPIERLALGVHDHDLDCPVTIGIVEGVTEFTAQDRRDGVVLLGSAKYEVADGTIVFDADGITHRQFLSNDGLAGRPR